MAAKKKGKIQDEGKVRSDDCRGIRRVNLMVVDDYQEREAVAHFFRIEVDFIVDQHQANLLRGHLGRPTKGGDEEVMDELLKGSEYGAYAAKVLKAVFDTQ
ncbi:MAG: hypothetical protein IPK85_00305 [Gemmatimonadetes bacterium]|nr:hypothetical protein [Gemmatimonadota bacterium]